MLLSAIGLFSSKGYKATTTKEIAAMSGVNELTLFRHFGSKERLLEAAIDRSFAYDDLMASLPPLSGDTESDLLTSIDHLRSSMRLRAPLYRLMLREFSTNEMVRERLRELPRKVKVLMVERIGSILRSKMKRGSDIELATVFLISYFIRSEMMTILMGEDPFHEVDDVRSREVVRMFLNGVLREGAR